MTYTAAHPQGVMKTFWFQFLELLWLSIGLIQSMPRDEIEDKCRSRTEQKPELWSWLSFKFPVVTC